MNEELSLVEKAKNVLKKYWKNVQNDIEKKKLISFISNSYDAQLIDDCINSKTKSYRYVLPSQVLAKLINSDLDCRSIQKAWKSNGSFDARSIAHEVIVPFDQSNYQVLGGSAEPYVNNPLRCAAVTNEFRDRQKNKSDWDKLTNILENIENINNNEIENYYKQILLSIHKRLSEIRINYPTPNRISFYDSIHIINEYLKEKSGGERLETIVTALFLTIGNKFKLFDDIQRGKVNAADISSGSLADIECISNGQKKLLVEVKDRKLTLTHLESKIDKARIDKVKEILFLSKGIEEESEKRVKSKIRSEFVSGQNIYVIDFDSFLKNILILFGEDGRTEFISNIGPELERVNAAIKHKRDWVSLLKQA